MHTSLHAGDSGAVRIAFSDYSVGEHVLTVSASDAAGKTAVEEVSFTVLGMQWELFDIVHIINALCVLAHVKQCGGHLIYESTIWPKIHLQEE